MSLHLTRNEGSLWKKFFRSSLLLATSDHLAVQDGERHILSLSTPPRFCARASPPNFTTPVIRIALPLAAVEAAAVADAVAVADAAPRVG